MLHSAASCVRGPVNETLGRGAIYTRMHLHSKSILVLTTKDMVEKKGNHGDTEGTELHREISRRDWEKSFIGPLASFSP